MGLKSTSRDSADTVDADRDSAQARDADAPEEEDEQASLDRAEFRAEAQADVAEAAHENGEAAEPPGLSAEDVNSPYARGWTDEQAERATAEGGSITIDEQGHMAPPDREAGTAATARRDYMDNSLEDEIYYDGPEMQASFSREQDMGPGSPVEAEAQATDFEAAGYGELTLGDTDSVFATPNERPPIADSVESLAEATPEDVEKPKWSLSMKEEALGKQRLAVERRATAAEVAKANHPRAEKTRAAVEDARRKQQAAREERIVGPEPAWDSRDFVDEAVDKIPELKPTPVPASIDPDQLVSTAESLADEFPTLSEEQAGQVLYEFAEEGINPREAAFNMVQRREDLRVPGTVTPIDGLDLGVNINDDFGDLPADIYADDTIGKETTRVIDPEKLTDWDTSTADGNSSPADRPDHPTKIRGEVIGAFDPSDPDTQHQVLVVEDQWGGRTKVTLFNAAKERGARQNSFAGSAHNDFGPTDESRANGLVEGERFSKGDSIEVENFAVSPGWDAADQHVTSLVTVEVTSNSTIRRLDASGRDPAPTGLSGNSVKSFKTSSDSYSKPDPSRSGLGNRHADYSGTSRNMHRRIRRTRQEHGKQRGSSEAFDDDSQDNSDDADDAIDDLA